MKTTYIGIILLLTFIACNQSADKNESFAAAPKSERTAPNLAAEEEKPVKYMGSTLLNIHQIDTARRFILTAELKFEVKSVIDATYNIENIVQKNGGLITQSNITNNIRNTQRIEISEDSSMLVKYYAFQNSLILRVPYQKLDTTLREIAKNIHFLDYRHLKAQDVTLDILANDLTQNRTNANAENLRTATTKKPSNINEITDAENAITDRKMQSDKAKIENLRLDDKVKFSVIIVDIYQKEAVTHEIVVNEKDIEAYKPNFFIQAYRAMKSGFTLFGEFILAILNLWLFIALFFGLFMVYKKYKNAKK